MIGFNPTCMVMDSQTISMIRKEVAASGDSDALDFVNTLLGVIEHANELAYNLAVVMPVEIYNSAYSRAHAQNDLTIPTKDSLDDPVFASLRAMDLAVVFMERALKLESDGK